ncbi:MAG: ATP-binding cassette domain-containing protein [Treponemataceae bacterium]
MHIDVKDISFSYLKNSEFETKALQNVSIQIKKGEFLGIMGTTGSGKTTFLNCIAGFIKQDKGIIEYKQTENSLEKNTAKCKIGFIFQYPEHQLFESTVFSDIAFGLKKYKLNPQQIKEKVYSAMNRAGLPPEIFSQRFPYSLSGGEKRKVAIAGVLVSEPDILLLDEPTAGLDPASCKNILQYIKNVNKQGKTIVMISHSPDCLAEYCTRIAVFKNGRIVKIGTPYKIFTDSNLLQESGIEPSSPVKIVQSFAARGINITAQIRYKKLFDEVFSRIKEKEKQL